jgi:hypothetical protein
MSDGWTTVGALKPGDLFEDCRGRRWYRTDLTTDPGETWDEVWCLPVGGGERDSFFLTASVRPLQPVPVAPALDPTLRGLLLRALETGETHALFDHLTETSAPRDLADAVRANVIREMDGPPAGVDITTSDIVGWFTANNPGVSREGMPPVNSADWLRNVPVRVVPLPPPNDAT